MTQTAIRFDTESLWLLNCVLALVMFGIALDMKPEGFRNLIRRPKALWVGVTGQFLLLPALTFALVWILEPPPEMALGMILVAACP